MMKKTNDISHVLRLFPGNDLRLSIETFVSKNKINAGWIVTCVGSLTTYSIRFANQRESAIDNGYFEILGLAGTVSINGCHLHITIADGNGKTIGGHLMQGSKIYTTAEIVLIESCTYIFKRSKDDITRFKELQVKKK